MNGFCIIGLFPKVNKRTNNTLCFPSKTLHKHAFCIRTIASTKRQSAYAHVWRENKVYYDCYGSFEL